MRTFTIIWIGQLASTIGSYMTEFALSLWAWELTESATALALTNFFFILPRIPMTLFAGIIVDRFNRKQLMMLGDTVAALSTFAILLLYLTNSLQIWHLYVVSGINGGFSEIQQLAYSASLSQIVPSQHYTRATSMGSMIHYGAAIFAPALAGSLYPLIGLLGILFVDLGTFGIAIASLLFLHIPQPSPQPHAEKIWQQLTFGLRYILTTSGLTGLLIINTLFWFAHDLGGALYTPMILARSGGDSQVLGTVFAAAGVGGVTGAIILSTWGGFKRRIHGMLLGFMGAGIAKTIFGFGNSALVWIPAQFSSSLNFPLLSSSEKAIWLAKVPPEIQGRVFATSSLALQVVSAVAALLAGFLADSLFEPAMMPGGFLSPVFGTIFGTQKGSGIALLYIVTSMSLFFIGLSGYGMRSLQQVEKNVG